MGGQAGVGSAEEQTPGGRVDEDRPQAEDVAGRGEVEAADLFRRHEARGTDQHARARVQAVPGEAVHGPCDAEVDDPGPVDGDQDVGRLEVTVDQTRLVHRLQSEGEAVGESADRVLGQGAEVLGDHGAQVGARDVLGRHPGDRGVGIRVEHLRGPAAAHPARGRHFTGESPAELLVPRVLGLHDLDGHGASGFGPAQIDQAHAALAQPGDQTVRAQPGRVFGGQRIHEE